MAWKKKGQQVRFISVDEIRPNPAQPRRQFDESALRELSQSIARYGVLQPISVRRGQDGYEIVAGERRLRAARMAGLREVPCLETKADAEDSAILALIENIQRQDLTFLEEAEAIDALIRRHGLSQEEAARRLGKSQGAVGNKLRLLRLSPYCREILIQGGLTERHGRCALRLEGEQDRVEALTLMARNGWTVRRSEEYIERRLAAQKAAKPKGRKAYILKDVRLFLNSLDRSVRLMRQSGVAAEVSKEEREEEILLTIRIGRKKQGGSVIKL
ncbi:MAG: ParB/RepB/Spo0J family partition protein [Oscillospiraceae bacterium]|nr:ParB/RepB/Spo0J family partition protein [Oscillospiraceae bacterium]